MILEVLSSSGASIREFRSVAKTQRSWCCVFASTKRQQRFWASCWTYVSGFFTVARWKPFLHAYRTFIGLTNSLDMVIGVYSQWPKIPKIRHFEGQKNRVPKSKNIFSFIKYLVQTFFYITKCLELRNEVHQRPWSPLNKRTKNTTLGSYGLEFRASFL